MRLNVSHIGILLGLIGRTWAMSLQSKEILKPLVMEVRSALNYQTEKISDSLLNLTEVMNNHHVNEESRYQLSDLFQTVGALNSDFQKQQRALKRLSKKVEHLQNDQDVVNEDLKSEKERVSVLNEQVEKATRSLEICKKKNSVFFDAFRNSSFTAGNLSYDGVLGNSGDDSLNIFTGIFDCRVGGHYAFAVHANTIKGDDALLLVRKNGRTVGAGFDTDNYNHNMLGQMVLLNLEEGDKVWIEVNSGGARSNENIYVHFVGFLLG